MAIGEYFPFFADSPVSHGVNCTAPTAQQDGHQLGVWVTTDASDGTLTAGVPNTTYSTLADGISVYSDEFYIVIRHDSFYTYTLTLSFPNIPDDPGDEYLYISVHEYYPSATGTATKSTPYRYSDLDASNSLTHTLVSGANPCGNKIHVDWLWA